MSAATVVLHAVQSHLKVPKSEWNDFGKYRYRNAESILQAVKPLLPDGWTVVCDCRAVVPEQWDGSGRPPVICECRAELTNGTEFASATAYAVEPESKKGMDAAQLSGATISYAKKYALANLFAIDGTEDSDSLQAEPEDAPAASPKETLWREVQAYVAAVRGSGGQCPDARELYTSLFEVRPMEMWTGEDYESAAADYRRLRGEVSR